MAKGRIVTDSVRALIAKTKSKHEKWTAREVRDEVEYILRQQDETVPKGWPGLSVVQRTVADMKRNAETPSPLDGPWHLGTLDNYPIAHAAIPAVLEAWKARITRVPASGAIVPFTIREAKWAARLSALVRDTERLSDWALQYATLERVYESIGRPFFSGALDAGLLGFHVRFSGVEEMSVLGPLNMARKEARAKRAAMAEQKPEEAAAEILARMPAAEIEAKVRALLAHAAANPPPVVDASRIAPEAAAPKRKRKGGK